MEEDLKDPKGTYTDRWWIILDFMKKMWSQKDMISETAKIVCLLALPQCQIQFAGIVPDDSMIPSE